MNAPAKLGANTNEAFGDESSSVEVDEEIVVDDPKHFEVVAAREVDGFFDELLRRKSVPFAAVDTGVRAIRTIERTGQAGNVHGPATSATALVGVEVGKMIGLRGQIDDGFEWPLGSEVKLLIALEAEARN